jgi:hypothetical protein
MAYIPIRSGFTGPSEKIGGSSPYHIDLKINEKLPLAERIKAFDAVVKQYNQLGREVEFSNANVSGLRWNPAANFDDKVKLFNQAAAAHSHSMHPGWNSLDFYVPFKGKDRFAKGAVEGASIYLPGVPGGKIRRASGGGYGYYSEALDPEGNPVFKVGHGDISRPEKESELSVPSLNVSTQQELPSSSNQSNQNALAQSMLEMFVLGLGVQKQKQPDLKEQMMTSLVQETMTPMQSPVRAMIQQSMRSPSPYSYLKIEED